MKTFVLLFTACLFVVFSACDSSTRHDEDASHKMAAAKYTCPMHPDIATDGPGHCPICGMELVKASTVTEKLMLTDPQIQLANIKVQSASKRGVGESVIMNGVLAVDKNRRTSISSRVAGRIERLFVKETGHTVVKGQPLYVLYSESLLTLQQEYFMAKRQQEMLGTSQPGYKSLLEAAKRKLMLYGLSEMQIGSLDEDRLEPRVAFLSRSSGIVTAIKVLEGQYVNEGAPIFEIEDLSSLWVEAEVYPEEARHMKRGDRVSVSVTGSQPLDVQISFLSPQYEKGTQIFLLRAEVPNNKNLFKPGQHAEISYKAVLRTAIALPTDAVIRTGDGEHVYVRTEHNTFEPRPVRTGLEDAGHVEIVQGLNEKDTVVVSGAYLLYSEMVLKHGREPLTVFHH